MESEDVVDTVRMRQVRRGRSWIGGERRRRDGSAKGVGQKDQRERECVTKGNLTSRGKEKAQGLVFGGKVNRKQEEMEETRGSELTSIGGDHHR